MTYKNLSATLAFQRLKMLSRNPIAVSELLSPARIKSAIVRHDLLSFSYACSPVDDAVLDALKNLAEEMAVVKRYESLLAGEAINTTENRPALHHKTRGKNRGFYGTQQQRANAFAEGVRSGQICSFSGKRFRHIVQIGIGGSELGPRALYTALQRLSSMPLQVHFAANADPDNMAWLLKHLDLSETLFIAVSKSGSTLETLANLEVLRQRAAHEGVSEFDLKQNLVAVTTANSQMDKLSDFRDIFFTDEAIGGRYSATSVVGGLVLSLAFGPAIFEEVLRGAHQTDEASREPDPLKNAALLSALINVWERSFLNFPAKALVPYSEALSAFTAHIQQLDCESNGKRASMSGKICDYFTGAPVIGEIGTNAQHSFFQLLHQGTATLPVTFIGFKQSQMGEDCRYNGQSGQDILLANLIAQMVALATGQTSKNPNQDFPGNRPSSLVFGQQLNPQTLGALLAFFENVVMFEGFLWNVNSFDQEGVELGKKLANQLLMEPPATSPLLTAFRKILD